LALSILRKLLPWTRLRGRPFEHFDTWAVIIGHALKKAVNMKKTQKFETRHGGKVLWKFHPLSQTQSAGEFDQIRPNSTKKIFWIPILAAKLAQFWQTDHPWPVLPNRGAVRHC